MSKKDLNIFLRMICTSTRKNDGIPSVYQSSSLKSLWEPPLSNSFVRYRSKISDPAFTNSKLRIRASQKNGQHCRCIRTLQSETVRKQLPISCADCETVGLWDSGKLGGAESKNPAQLQRMTKFYLGLFISRRGRENQLHR